MKRRSEDLQSWQVAFAFCLAVYKETAGFPTEERYGLAVELRKTSRSVVCNIAEGYARRTTVEYLRFLDIARGSLAEVRTQLLLARDLGYLTGNDLFGSHDSVERLLMALTAAIEKKIASKAA